MMTPKRRNDFQEDNNQDECVLSEDSGRGHLILSDQLIQIKVLHQFETFYIFTELPCDFFLFVPDEVAEVAHLSFQVVGKVETLDFSHAQHQVIVVQTFFGDANHLGRIGEIAPLALMQFSPYLDGFDDLADSSLALLDLLVAFLQHLPVFATGAPLLQLVDHPALGMLLLHGVFLLQFLDFICKIDSHFEFVVFESAIAVIGIGILIIFQLISFILREDVTSLFGGGVCFDQDFVLIEGFEDDFAISVGLYDGAKLGQVEFFILDDESFGGKVDEYLAKGYFSVLFELGDVDIESSSHLIFIYDNKLAAYLLPTSREVPEFIIVNTHYNQYMNTHPKKRYFNPTLLHFRPYPPPKTQLQIIKQRIKQIRKQLYYFQGICSTLKKKVAL